MSVITTIAKDEWRLWRRSRLVMITLLLACLLIVAASLFTAIESAHNLHQREHQQEVADDTFKSQPNRHPHRMVHYGHYVFRTPGPLAIFDPGVDLVTGQSMFLEGHHQNTAMFADSRASARTGGFGFLTTATIYQLFLPLVLIALGHTAVAREREAGTLLGLLTQGATGPQILLGKMAAQLLLVCLLCVPAVVIIALAIARGESILAALVMLTGYFLYLLIWVALIGIVSCFARSRSVVLGILLTIWFVAVLVIPRTGVAVVDATLPVDGKIVTDLRMQAGMRALGDGHNASDPAFDRLREKLLAENNVSSIEELPFNFRGAVAGQAEEALTQLMNDYAEARMDQELAQSMRLQKLSLASPFLAINAASRTLAGTDLHTHHRFLREAEALRYAFVQGLNKVHIEELAYADDINRNSNEDASQRARVSSDNWNVLKEFQFHPSTTQQRMQHAGIPLLSLIVWFAVLMLGGLIASRKLQ